MNFELPLVFFTVLSQVALGLAIFVCWTMFRNPAALPDKKLREAWLSVFIVSGCGLLASLFHLGHPFQAYKALINLGGSWLSREVLMFTCFCLVALANAYVKSKTLGVVAIIVGCLGLIAQGITYGPPSMPSLHNAFPMALFALSALATGACALFYFTDGANVRSRPWILALFVLLLTAPCLWLSGSATMQATGSMWLHSILFWLGMICIAIAIIIGFVRKASQTSQFGILLLGIFFTRMIFFANTMHTAARLGMPYN